MYKKYKSPILSDFDQDSLYHFVDVLINNLIDREDWIILRKELETMFPEAYLSSYDYTSFENEIAKILIKEDLVELNNDQDNLKPTGAMMFKLNFNARLIVKSGGGIINIYFDRKNQENFRKTLEELTIKDLYQKVKWHNTNKIISISALIISVISLLVSVFMPEKPPSSSAEETKSIPQFSEPTLKNYRIK